MFDPIARIVADSAQFRCTYLSVSISGTRVLRDLSAHSCPFTMFAASSSFSSP